MVLFVEAFDTLLVLNAFPTCVVPRRYREAGDVIKSVKVVSGGENLVNNSKAAPLDDITPTEVEAV